MTSGQAVDMGVGVFKKRPNRNEHRATILARHGDYWVFEYLFAKQDKANISRAELVGFRELVTTYSNMAAEQIKHLIDNEARMELL